MTTAREHQAGPSSARRPIQKPKLVAGLAVWIARFQQQLSDHVFAKGDAFAREHGWEITKTTGRLSAYPKVLRVTRRMATGVTGR